MREAQFKDNDMGEIQRIVEAIKARYPELEINTAEINQDGQYNNVLVVNNVLIFRFARVKDAAATLRREISVLRHLQSRISLSIPDPQFVGIDSDRIGEVFMGYPMIPGIPLWRENFRKITEPEIKQRMAVQLGVFLKELHQVPLQGIPISLENMDTPAYWLDMYRRIEEKLYVHMRPDARRSVSDHFEEYLAAPDRYHFQPVLKHGDFGTGNILYDQDRQSISGVIDFGGVGSGDPAGDFAGLYVSFGDDFYRDCCSVYPEMETAFDRVKFYVGTFALQEALFGVENGDQAAFESGIEAYI